MEELNLAVVGRRLKSRRKELKISQEQMHLDLNMTISFISKLENGKTSTTLAMMTSICQYLNMDLSDVVRGINPQGPKYLEDEFALRIESLNSKQRELALALLDAIINNS